MVTRVSAAMMADGSGPQAGDYCLSARTSKPRWLLCDGAAYSRAVHAALYAEIGTAFGAGDGSTTFNVPGPQGKALVIAGNGTIKESVAASAVTVATDLVTVPTNVDKWVTGMKVRASSTGALPAGLAAATDYYIIRISATTLKLASSLANAAAGTAIDITSQGSGVHTIAHTLTARAIGDVGGEEAHADIAAEMPSHRHRLYGDGAYGGAVITGLADGNSKSVAGNTNTSGKAYVDMNNGVPVVENTGAGQAHNNMPPFVTVGNLFIYSGVLTP